MDDYKKWYQGTTQEAYDRFVEKVDKFVDECLDEIFETLNLLFGWLYKLILKIRKKK